MEYIDSKEDPQQRVTERNTQQKRQKKVGGRRGCMDSPHVT